MASKPKRSTSKHATAKDRVAKPRVQPKSKPAAKVPASKPRVAFYWCSSCGGCEETVVDLDHALLDVVAAVDILFWPCALDFKVTDLDAIPDQTIDVAFINGAIRTSEQDEMVRKIRQKAKCVIAFGMCATHGGIPALANLKSDKAILQRAYCEAETVADNADCILPQTETPIPQGSLHLPHFFPTVLKLADVIPVDYYLPGCPPTAHRVAEAVQAILTGQLPAPGSVLAPNISLCHSCSRNLSKPDNLSITEIHRIHQVVADPSRCFLAQGILCMGPATRDGCGELCIHGNMPCTGCFGPLAGCDPGARMIGTLGGILSGESDKDIQPLVDRVVDPAGTFYRYTLSSSWLGKKREEKSG